MSASSVVEIRRGAVAGIGRIVGRDLLVAAMGLLVLLGFLSLAEFVNYGFATVASPPGTLHLWGHQYSSGSVDGQGETLVSPPVSGSRLPAGSDVREITPVAGMLGLVPLDLPLGKPPDFVWHVYLKVGPDLYKPYRLVTCCEPSW